MILATIDGILWADAKKLDLIDGIYRGYMRWYYSQTGEEPRRGQRTWMRRQPHEREFCLLREKFMHARRNPEEGLLGAFSKDAKGSTKIKVNDSKGSAALARAIPIGLLFAGDSKAAFDEAVRAAALSHSNPVGYYAAGGLAAMISCLAYGLTLPKALERAETLLGKVHKPTPSSPFWERQKNRPITTPQGNQAPGTTSTALCPWEAVKMQKKPWPSPCTASWQKTIP